MFVKAEGLPPNTDFDFFVIQVPNAPFGMAWYQGDFETNSAGAGLQIFVGVNFHARMTRFGVGLTRKADQPDTLCSLSGATWSDMRGDDRQDPALASS
jgi:hypothetical protein